MYTYMREEAKQTMYATIDSQVLCWTNTKTWTYNTTEQTIRKVLFLVLSAQFSFSFFLHDIQLVFSLGDSLDCMRVHLVPSFFHSMEFLI